MAFRVLIAGGRGFFAYPVLRDFLDAVLADRLPDVVVLTTGGPGVPALAASYATSRNLELVARVPDHHKHRGDARERRNAELVAAADALVVVPVPVGRGQSAGSDTARADVEELVALARKKGIPVRVVGAAGPKASTGVPVPEQRWRGLPD